MQMIKARLSMKMKSGLMNKDRLCERSEPQSYPLVGQARHGKQGSSI